LLPYARGTQQHVQGTFQPAQGGSVSQNAAGNGGLAEYKRIQQLNFRGNQ
jgi:hypothetical protein